MSECPVHAYGDSLAFGASGFHARMSSSQSLPFGKSKRMYTVVVPGLDYGPADLKNAVLPSSPRGVAWGSTSRGPGFEPDKADKKPLGPGYIGADATLVTLPRAPGGVAFGHRPLTRRAAAAEGPGYISCDAAKVTFKSSPHGVPFGTTDRDLTKTKPAQGPNFISADAKLAVLHSAPRALAWGTGERKLGQQSPRGTTVHSYMPVEPVGGRSVGFGSAPRNTGSFFTTSTRSGLSSPLNNPSRSRSNPASPRRLDAIPSPSMSPRRSLGLVTPRKQSAESASSRRHSTAS